MEIWKTIDNVKDCEVSSEGRVRKITPNGIKILKFIRDKKPAGYKNHIIPYFRVVLKQKDSNKIKFVKVHRLVAEVFCNRISKEHRWVDHINRNPIDNRAENLRWVTPSESAYNRKYLKKKDYIKLVLKIIKEYYPKGKLELINKISKIK